MFQEPTPEAPVPFGAYELIRRIGAGGMGEVFLAREKSNGATRACVVKKVLPSLQANRAFVGRFLDESKVVVRLNHPNVARVYAMGEADGEYFLTMEYVQGKTVSRFTKRLRDRKQHMPLGLILLLGERVCTGLQYAHDANDEHGQPLQLVHRDLSPANVCISYRGEVKIIDFGAAQSTLKEEQTAPRVVIGNLTYMAPEQAKKQFVDRRADVYSTGVMLWELLSWFALPQKGDPIERWRKAANPHWDAPSVHNPNVPPELDQLVLRALRKEPEARYKNAAELGTALREMRARLAPQYGDAELGKLLSKAFAREKAAEDAVLGELLGKPINDVPTDKRRRAVVPPTALAFEHTAVLADDVPSEDELTDPGRAALGDHPPDVTPRREPVALTQRKKTLTAERMALPLGEAPFATRRAFGVQFEVKDEPLVERSLEEEIDGTGAEEIESDPDYETSAYGGKGAFAVIAIGVFLAAVGLGFLGVWVWATLH
ncbi:MAG: serine/threonine protein kinase [Archangiaceae bacterium]|nr:serine/threonine protein kinase [Archangiaceae bacterium]